MNKLIGIFDTQIEELFYDGDNMCDCFLSDDEQGCVVFHVLTQGEQVN